jgi:hypothetical protein
MSFGEVLIVLISLGAIYFAIRKVTQKGKPTAAASPKLSELSTNIPEEVFETNLEILRNDFVDGKFADEMSTDLILKKNEHLIFDIPGVSLCEERTVKTKGKSNSVRIRVMKGVTVGTGRFEAAPEAKVVPIDIGNLTLTSRRVHFAGETKTVDFALSSMNTIEAFDSGISVSRSGKTKIEYFLDMDRLKIESTFTPDEGEDFEPEEITYALNGGECKKIFLEAISRLD